jgi:hypothetical protein
MSNKFKEKKEEKIKTKKVKKPNKVARSFMDVLNGNVLTKDYVIQNLPFIVFITALMLVYIGMGYNIDKNTRLINALEEENLDLRTEEIAVKTEYNVVSGQSQVADSTAKIGLVEARDEAPNIIAVPNETLNNLY